MDQELLDNLKPDDDPILHFYNFSQPAFTFGYFTKPHELLNMERAKKTFDYSRRPTGGGILFHMWDLTFSAVVPKNHPGYSKEVMKNYRYINDRVLEAVKSYLGSMIPVNLLPEEPYALDELTKHFCFAKPTKYDVMLGGKKVAGAAQRRKKQGFLHQGSISLIMPSFTFLGQFFPPNSKVADAMKMHTHALLLGELTQEELKAAKEDLSKELVYVFQESA